MNNQPDKAMITRDELSSLLIEVGTLIAGNKAMDDGVASKNKKGTGVIHVMESNDGSYTWSEVDLDSLEKETAISEE